MKTHLAIIGAVAIFAPALPMAAQAQNEATAEAAEEEAEPASALVHMDLVASQSLGGAMERYFDAGQIAMLRSVAHQQTAAILCEGFEIDPERYREEMNRIYYDGEGEEIDVTPDELHALEKHAMLGFGMALGSQIAIAAYDEAGFCAHAEEEREAEDRTHIIWAPPDDSQSD